MTDRRPQAQKCILYGLTGIVLWIGPIIYFLYRRSKYDLENSELPYLIGAAVFSVGLTLYGGLLYLLELLRLNL
jgi:hypothetical protein